MYGIARDRHFIRFHCMFIISSVVSSSIPSKPVSISYPVGSQAILPCNWMPQLYNVPIHHIQWQTPDDTVFEQKGEQRWQAPEFKGRVEVPEEKLQEGDCSLIVHDVQLGDVGLYESFVVVESAGTKRRVFLQSVQLSVYDHKSKVSLGVGEDMNLKLYTPKAMRVVFQKRSSKEWTVLWVRGDKANNHHFKEAERVLVIKGLRMDHSGTYKVLDFHGGSVNTVNLMVEEVAGTQTLSQIHQKQEAVGKSFHNRSSILLIIFVLQISLLIQYQH
ncbi:coxsackievirus and adenovirus receptor homolog isoform X1 [Esox lucius]|uniref:Immunoglobulin V-set domain-containing protein n=2 Tax=Esox lucius TaxID=8010 RepID=A0A3P8YSF9_ESOLU|nr:coxsackievirus and adenovirus receptor homolog isoform X1 [Esox lucius]